MIGHLWRWWRMASVVLALATTGYVVLPHAWDAAKFWWWWSTPIQVIETKEEIIESTDPHELTEFHLDGLTAEDYRQGIEDALAADDVELANSLVELATQRKMLITDELAKRVSEAQPPTIVGNVWDGVNGEPDAVTGYAAHVVTSLSPVGDFRDLRDEFFKYPDYDTMTVTLSAMGLVASGVALGTVVITSITPGAQPATPVVIGSASFTKVGLASLKSAWKVVKKNPGTVLINPKLISGLKDLAGKAVNPAAVRELRDRLMRFDYDGSATALGKVVRKRVINELSESGTALGSLAKARGPKATLDSLHVAQSTKDLTTLGKLSERSGGTYRAVLKMSGGKILGPIKKLKQVTKVVKRGRMALNVMAELLGWILSGLLWAASCIWTTVKIGWRVIRFMLRSPVTPAPNTS